MASILVKGTLSRRSSLLQKKIQSSRSTLKLSSDIHWCAKAQPCLCQRCGGSSWRYAQRRPVSLQLSAGSPMVIVIFLCFMLGIPALDQKFKRCFLKCLRQQVMSDSDLACDKRLGTHTCNVTFGWCRHYIYIYILYMYETPMSQLKD